MHNALDVSHAAARSWQSPLTVDARLHYCLLGSCYGCFLACLATFWVATADFPPRELLFPFHRATAGDAASANAARMDSVIAISADGSLTLDGRNVGKTDDRQLHALTSALLLRQREQSTGSPLVIHVAPRATHGRIVEVLNAVVRAGSPGYVLLFADTPTDEFLWKGRR